MKPDETHPQRADAASVGERNIEKLLDQAYDPEQPDEAFAERVGEQMLAAARRGADRPRVVVLSLGRTIGWGAVAAAALIVAGFVLSNALRTGPQTIVQPRPVGPVARRQLPATAVAGLGEGLTPRPRPTVAAAKSVAVGVTIETQPRERRRVTLPDGSVLYVNAETTLTVRDQRRVELNRGEVYVDVAASKLAAGRRAAFVVRTPGRAVVARGTKFAVRVGDAGTDVLVTQGKVSVSGHPGLVHAGRQLACGRGPSGGELTVAPRASHELEWTKDLIAAAESPLVPASKFAGGALVALDPQGQEARLSLRKYHVDVHVEDGFARTTIDQTYFNHMPRRLEGTFYFPLPPDASISRLAMYVGENLMEGGMAERAHARYVFETIMHTRRDPALLEWVDGTTFKMRVFPLEGRQEKRIVLSYTQRLESLYGRAQYRFAGGHNMPMVGEWSFHARVVGAAKRKWALLTHEPKATTDGEDLLIDVAKKNVKPDDDVVLQVFEDDAEAAGKFERFSTTVHDGHRYLMLRYRPELEVAAGPEAPDGDSSRSGIGSDRQRRDWVFLYESAGDRDPLLARAQIDVIRTMLDNAEHDDRFSLLAAGTHVRSFFESPQPATPANVAAAVEWLEKTHLVGALDLAGALTAADRLLREADNAHLVHVGSGVPILGRRETNELVKLIPLSSRYVGVGVGKRFNRGFMKEAAARTGGYFTQINPDENVAWRAFDLIATLNTPRLLAAKVASQPGKARWLLFADSLADGQELCAVARVDPADPPPEAVTVTGTLDGKEWSRTVPLVDAAEGADYLPRFWAKLEIDRLLAADAKANKDQVIALSKAMYVMSPFTSLLVLENEAMYKQYKVDRGRKDHWALYPAPKTIKVVHEPLPGHRVPRRPAEPGKKDEKPSAQQVLGTILIRIPPRFLRWPNEPSYYGGQTLTAWQLLRGGYAVPILDRDTGGLWRGGRRDYYFRERDEALKANWGVMHGDALQVSERLGTVFDAVTGGALPGSWNGRSTGDWMNGPVWDGGRSRGRRGRAGKPLSLSSLETGFSKEAGLRRKRPAPPPARQPPGLFSFRDLRRSEVAAPAGPVPPFGGPTLMATPADEVSRLMPSLALPPGELIVADESSSMEEGRPASAKEAQAAYGLYHRLSRGGGWRRGVQYQRPYFTNDWRLFSDVLIYAPGLNTTWTDVRAVVAAEAKSGPASAPGKIDPKAAAMIERARGYGWRSVTLPARSGREALTVVYDGAGRYAYQRRTAFGLAERVICDGKRLLHLYHEIGLGAKRTLSRFHRAELAGLIPWSLPPVEDLAVGCDVLAVDENTVAVRAARAADAKDEEGKPAAYAELRLVFAADGRLAERRLVKMPDGKLLARQTYATDGAVRWLDADGKELAKVKLTVGKAAAPLLTRDLGKLVVLPLPMRTRNHIYATRKLKDTGGVLPWSADDALAVIAVDAGRRNWHNMCQIVGRRFFVKGDRRIGFYVLLLAASQSWDTANDHHLGSKRIMIRFDPAKDHPRSILGRYVASQVEANRSGKRDRLPKMPGDDFVSRLGEFRRLYDDWNSGRATRGKEAQRKARREEALSFIRKSRSSMFGWAILARVQNRGGDRDWYRRLSEAARQFEGVNGLTYSARYEAARMLYSSSDYDAARAAFRKLYADTLAQGVLPPVDRNFRSAMQRGKDGGKRWTEFMRDTAAELIEEKESPAAVVRLAWQCFWMGDQPLGEELLATALTAADKDRRAAVRLMAVEALCQLNRWDRADALMAALLADEKLADSASVWRLAALVAQRRGRTASSLKRLEKAIAIEFDALPDVVNLQAVRREYGQLLGRYQQLAQAIATLEAEPPKAFLQRVVRAADQWRALDPDDTAACQAAARVLQSLGARELAWEYLTTPLALRPNEAAPWTSLAAQLKQQGELELADRAYASAFETEQTNAQILWERAQLAQQLGQRDRAVELYRRIADGKWPRQFNWVQRRARQYLGRM